MDGISAVVTVSALVESAIGLLGIYQKIKSGHKEREDLRKTLQNVHRMLLDLHDQLQRYAVGPMTPWSRCITPILCNGGDLDELRETLGDIVSKLEIGSQSLLLRGKRTLMWPIDAVEVNSLMKRINAPKHNIQIALERAALAISEEIHETGKDIRTIVTEDLVRRISPLDFREVQQSFFDKAVGTTAEWLYKTPAFQGWAQRAVPSLWCHGIQGAGKSVLASAAYEFLKRSTKNDKDNALVMIVFFNWHDKATHSVNNIVHSLIRQAIEERGVVSQQLLALCAVPGFRQEAHQTHREAILQALRDEIRLFKHTYIILDGLDEIHDEQIRSEMLCAVEALDAQVQLMISARELQDINNWFYDKSQKHRCRILKQECSDDSILARQDQDFSFHRKMRKSARRGTLSCQTGDDKLFGPHLPACFECVACHTYVCASCFLHRKAEAKARANDKATCGHCGADLSQYIYIWARDVEITARSEDIQTYVKSRFQNSPVVVRQLSRSKKSEPGLTTKIIELVVKHSNKMFLLAIFHVDKILAQATAGDMLRVAKELQNDVAAAYDDTFKRIETFPTAQYVKVLLKIVTFALKPLSIAQLEHAIATEVHQGDIEALDLPDATDLLNKCLGLVTKDSNNIVSLSHETLGVYMAKSIDKTSADFLMTKICLSYFRQAARHLSTHKSETLLQRFDRYEQQYPLLPYAAIYWGAHARRANSQEADEQAQSFLQDPNCVRLAAVIMSCDNLERGSGWTAEKDVTSLHLAAHFGLVTAIRRLLIADSSVNASDSMGITPLMYAIDGGHHDAVGVLLDAKADAKLACESGRTALHRACSKSDADMVKMLIRLDKIAVDAVDKSRHHMTALQIVAQTGDINIMRHLLTRSDISVNLPSGTPCPCTGSECTALHVAVSYKRFEALKLLVQDPRIMLDAVDSSGSTALAIACTNGFREAVSLLLSQGADPNTCDKAGVFPLFQAVKHENLQIVRTLLTGGAEAKAKTFRKQGIVHASASHDSSETLHHLHEIINALDINAKGDQEETPLHEAVKQGHAKTVTALLQRGARTDIKDIYGRTPVKIALETGQREILHLLSQARAEEQAASLSKARAEEYVHRSDTLSNVQVLSIHAAVRVMADAELQDHCTALGDRLKDVMNTRENSSGLGAIHIAARFQHSQKLQLLIKYGADLNLKSLTEETALHTAARSRNLEAAMTLVTHKAEMNVADVEGHTPLDRALTDGDPKMAVAILLAKHDAVARSHLHRLRELLLAAVSAGDLEAVIKVCSLGAKFGSQHVTDLSIPYQQAKRLRNTAIIDHLLAEQVRLRGSYASRRLSLGDGVRPVSSASDPSTPDVSSIEARDSIEDQQQAGTVRTVSMVARLYNVTIVPTYQAFTIREYCLLVVILALLLEIVL